jgi:alpha-tubulin suppressor-like RCC1 family protein
MAWGLNDYGQLGNGTTNTTGCKCNPTPGTVSGLTNVVAVSGGTNHSLALKADGTVWAWGANENAQLGDATTTNRLTPVKVGVGVSGFNSIIAIDAGGRHNLALKSDGTVWAWGDNNSGQIGDGTLTDLVLVVQITSLSNNILAVSAGNSHSMALSKTGQIYVWGQNDSGQLGNGTASEYAVAPTLNTNISGVAQIQAGGFHNVALKTDGTVWAWGNNALGQIGNGTAASISGCQCVMAPTQSSITNVIAIRAETGSHALARKKNGTIWAWGHNYYGQIGNGTTNTNIPSGVLTPVQSSVGAGNIIFGTGLNHSLLSVPTIPTPTGTNVVVRFGDGYVRFASVIFNGVNTIITAIDPTATGLTVPAGLTLAANSQAYDISNSLTPGNSDLTVCINATN